MEPHPVTAHDGKLLSPFRGARRNIRFFFKKDDHKASVSFKVNFGQGPKFARGLFKIALSSLAYFLGPTVALSHQFNTVREFVRHGRGKDTRYVMHKFADDRKYLNQAWPPYTSQSGDYVCIFRIAMSEFLVDLSDSQSYLAVLMENADNLYTQDKWFLLPPKR
ncbi:MAG: hypothetical protein AB2803_13775 [Candidatus Thiodiazotropha sp.]